MVMSAGAGRQRLCHAMPPDSPIEQVHRGVTAWFEGEMDAGRFRRMDVTVLARAFVAMIAHYAMTEALGVHPPFHPGTEAYLDGVVDLALNGLRPR